MHKFTLQELKQNIIEKYMFVYKDLLNKRVQDYLIQYANNHHIDLSVYRVIYRNTGITFSTEQSLFILNRTNKFPEFSKEDKSNLEELTKPIIDFGDFLKQIDWYFSFLHIRFTSMADIRYAIPETYHRLIPEIDMSKKPDVSLRDPDIYTKLQQLPVKLLLLKDS